VNYKKTFGNNQPKQMSLLRWFKTNQNRKNNLLKRTIKKTFVFANFPVVEPLILFLERKGKKNQWQPTVTQLWTSSITKKKKTCRDDSNPTKNSGQQHKKKSHGSLQQHLRKPNQIK